MNRFRVQKCQCSKERIISIWVILRSSVCIKQFKIEGESAKTLSMLYNLSISTIKRTVKQMENESSSSVKENTKRRNKIIDSGYIKQKIADFVHENRHHPFNWANIQQYLNNKVSVTIPLHAIRKFLINKMRYSFKRSAPLPTSLNMERIDLWKALFSIKIAKEMDKFDLIINIDESTLSKGVVEHYSWSPVGVPTPIQSIIFQKSVSIIAAITTEGLSFWCVRVGTTDSSIFVNYIKNLLKFLAIYSQVKQEKMWIILDNAKYHTSLISMKYLREIEAHVYYLPAYSPEL